MSNASALNGVSVGILTLNSRGVIGRLYDDSTNPSFVVGDSFL